MIRPVFSLRRRLLYWLLIPLAFMALALVAEAYISSKKSIEQIHDRMMVALAWSISEHVVESGGDLLSEKSLELLSQSSNERLFYQVIGPDNAFITGHAELPPPPIHATLESGKSYFYDALFEGQEVRLLNVKFLVEGRDINGWVQVRVAQTKTQRVAQLQEAVIRAALRIILVIGLASLLAIIGVNRGLGPLKVLQDSIQRRSYADLRPIDQEMPREVSQVVAALNSLLLRLGESIESQRRFISNASHQLRTPLAVLQAEAELALREVQDPKAREALEEIHQGTKQSSRLAKQLLSLTSVRSNPGGGLNQEPFDLVKAVKGVTLDWVKQALKAGKDLGLECDLQTQALAGSEFQIREMLANLIDNALKYGGDHISVRLYLDDENTVLEVEDNGIGIPKDKRGQVFERFVRLDERGAEGCGLGMDIVREIAEGHGGSVTLHDGQDGKGLKVRVLFL